MNTLSTLSRRALFAAALTIAGLSSASAHYSHDSKGWYDENHHRHSFVKYHGHRGYWDKDDGGVWAFIRI